MKKIILKLTSLAAAFLLGIVVMGYLTSQGNRDMTTTMEEATFPIVYLEDGDVRLNPLHGYSREMDGKYMREAITAVPEDRILHLSIDTYGTEVTGLSYEVRSLDTTRLVENTVVESFTKSKEQAAADLKIKDLLDPDQEYLLILKADTREGSIYYYTRIVDSAYERVSEAVDFALYFQGETMKKEQAGEISKYLEQSSSADNSTLAHVDIHSRYSMVIWDQMQVAMGSDIDVTVTEIDDNITSLRLDYVVNSENADGFTEKYDVSETYRIRYTDTRTYLLDFDRTMDRIFEGEDDFFTDKQLTLGILNTPVVYEKNEEENIVAFVQSGELWVYDMAQNKLSYVFGFRDGDDKRTTWQQHDIKLLSMDESGSMGFLVCGYMNRGRHEGSVGIAVYHYDSIANTVEEMLFVESDRSYEVLRTEVGDLAYMNQSGNFYLSFRDTIYMVDLATGSYQTIAENLKDDCYITSEDGTMLAWQPENNPVASKSIRVLNLETGNSYTREAQAGTYLKPLGFMDTDFIYGIARQEDIAKNLTGEIIFPMHQVIIQDKLGNDVRDFDYSAKGKYVIDVSIVDNRIQLECVQKDASGNYVEAVPEPITNKNTEKETKIIFTTRKSDTRKTEYVFSFTEKMKDTARKHLKPKEVLFEGDRSVQFTDIAGRQEKYYVYGRGKLDSVYVKANEAIQRADELMGVVISETSQYVWERGNRKTRNQLTGLEAIEFADARSSLSLCLESIFNYAKVYADVDAELQAGKSAVEIMKEHMTEKVLDLSGCSLSQVLYYVSQGRPVLAIEGDGQASLIVGYDPQNIVTFDPATGKTQKAGMKDSTAYYEGLGNVFVSYVE